MPRSPASYEKQKRDKKSMTIIQEEEFEESLKVPSTFGSTPNIIRNFTHVKKQAIKLPLALPIPIPEKEENSDLIQIEDLQSQNKQIENEYESNEKPMFIN